MGQRWSIPRETKLALANSHQRERGLLRKLAGVGDELARDQTPPEQPTGPGKTRYAKSGELSIAYQVVGTGPDLVLIPGSLSHVELGWETPVTSLVYRQLLRFSRTIQPACHGRRKGLGLGHSLS